MAEDLQQIYHKALAAHEQEDYERAVELYEQILVRFPDADLVLYNQGLALYQLNRFAEAASVFARAAEIRDDDADTWFNLGLALKQDSRYPEACRAYERALKLAPDDADIVFNLANCCREGGYPEQAAAYYDKLLNIEPEHVSGLNNFAYLCHLRGEHGRTEELYQRLLHLRPDHPGALHMLAALNGTADTTPANEYIQELFDQYSDTFEQSLVEKLEYRVPELLFDLVGRNDTGSSSYENCVDLGCGTGLAGVMFRPLCNRLTGVDLSEKMVVVAASKEVYDTLVTADVVQFLLQGNTQYDLFIAADLLTYMADLEPLFQAVSQKSLPDSQFVFSTEHGDDSGWQVRSTGRFAHHPDYVAEAIEKCSGKIVCKQEADLRREGENWIRGDIYLAVFN
ncbi:MAG: tetratricopeptide repeat protein [Thermodesulfobacteriota bacterium]|nr:tetratricopeptide repeat protein [Thermodesulfobacteriota bacterium]